MDEPMLQLKRPNVTPRSGYRYRDPDTGHEFQAPLLNDLVRRALRHRSVNHLDIPDDFPAVVEDYVCRLNPESFSMSRSVVTTAPSPASPSSISSSPRGTPPRLSEALRRTQTVLRTLVRRLPKDEAALRAPACDGCRYNIAEPCCYSCLVESVFEPTVGKHYSKWRDVVGVCALDRTFTKPLLFAETSFSEDVEYPAHCWKTATRPEEPDAEENVHNT